MVTNYEYEDWFYTGSHRKCLLFVEQDADVEIDAGQPPIVSLPSGETPIVITNEDILKERFELQENFNTAENWAFGSVEPSCVSIDIRQTDAIPILKGMTFRLYFYFDDNSSTLLYIGTYIFDTDDLSEDSKSRTISGYDMIQAIRDLDVIDFYRGLFAAHEEPDPENPEQKIWVPAKEKIKVKEARDALFSYLIMFEDIPVIQENVELPNDNFEFAFDVDTEALSAGQLLEDLCEINGRYGHLSRELSTFQFPLLPEIKNVQVFKYIMVERYDEPGTQIGNEVRIHGMKKGLYETNSIGRLRVYNRDDVLLASYDDGWKKHFSVYNIYDNILIDNLTKSKTTKSALKAMMKNIYDSIRYRKYVPFEAKAPADLCREVGDRITLYLDIDLQNEDENRSYKTLIFKRRISGIQNMTDTYSAEGDRNLPNFGDYSKSGGYSAKRSISGGSGTSREQKEGTDGDFTLEGMTSNELRLYLKNVGIQTLEEPTDVTAEVEIVNDALQVALKWTDPEDIVTNSPYPASWEGTVVVRKENESPKHRWDGVVKVKNSTTRDEFKDDAFIDTGVEPNKVYYYGFYPYFTQVDDGDLKIRHYTWTKIIKVSTENPIQKPEITNLLADGGITVTVEYTIPSLSIGTYEYCKLVAKKNSIPESVEDGDKIVEINPSSTSITVEGLDELSTYYFVIFVENDQGNAASSEPKNCETGKDEGYNFAYTGSIQEFTAPKTGIYQLETWGAQGGDATDGTLTARGGYGAYAVGEVFLAQGDTLYINVGGQNGYGGGGNFDGFETAFEDLIKTPDLSHYKSATGYDRSALSQYWNTDWNLLLIPEGNTTDISMSNNVYTLGKSNGVYGVADYSFIAKQTYMASKIRFSGRFLNSTNDNNHQLQIRLCKIENGSWVNKLRVVVAHTTGTSSDVDYTVSDTDFHTFEKVLETPVEFDYLLIYQGEYQVQFKDIVITII